MNGQVVENKFFRFKKKQQSALQKPTKPAPVRGTCKKCRASVTFLSNTLGGMRLIFCPNCKHINAQVKVQPTEAANTSQAG